MRHIVPKQTADVTSVPGDVDAPLPFPTRGSAVVRTLSAIGAELDAHAHASERPFWQSEPCPSWCEADGGEGTGHSGRDAYPDRRHVLFGAEVALSLCDADDGPDGAEVEPLCLWMLAGQHYRAAEPDVVIVVPLLANREGGPIEHEVRLTVGETRALSDALSELLAALDGSAR